MFFSKGLIKQPPRILTHTSLRAVVLGLLACDPFKSLEERVILFFHCCILIIFSLIEIKYSNNLRDNIRYTKIHILLCRRSMFFMLFCSVCHGAIPCRGPHFLGGEPLCLGINSSCHQCLLKQSLDCSSRLYWRQTHFTLLEEPT